MKRAFASLALTLLLAPVAVLHAQPATAVQALQALGKDRGEEFQSGVLQVIGIGGTDQPPVWRVIARDPFQPGAIRDFAIENGRVVGDQFVPPAYHARIPANVIDRNSIRADSGAVFLIANERARKSKIGFYSLDYEIRSTAQKPGEIWIVRLNGRARERVGELIVDAKSGQILRERWWQPSPDPAVDGSPEVPEEGARDSIEEQISEGWKIAKEGVSQGGALVRQNAGQAGRSVKGFFRGMFASEEAGTDGGSEERYGYRTPHAGETRVDAERYH